MKNKAAIIIVNWNGLKFLNDCLNSVYNQSYHNFDVYFVDNGSTDRSVDFVKKNFSQTKIVRLHHNTGFAKGNNEGIKTALKDEDVEFIVCLNNDTIVDKDWLKELVIMVDYKNNIEMISSQSLFQDKKIQTIGLRFEKNLIGNKIGGLSVGYGEDPQNYVFSKEIYCASGVSFLATRSMLEKIGLFDEDFFAYGEDMDLGIRARNKGYKCIYSPESKLVHLHSQTSGGVASPLKAYLSKRNNFYIAIKNFGFIDLILFPIRDLCWNIKSLFEKDHKKSVNKLKNKIGLVGMIKIILKVYLMVLIHLPKMFYKRYKIKKF